MGRARGNDTDRLHRGNMKRPSIITKSLSEKWNGAQGTRKISLPRLLDPLTQRVQSRLDPSDSHLALEDRAPPPIIPGARRNLSTQSSGASARRMGLKDSSQSSGGKGDNHLGCKQPPPLLDRGRPPKASPSPRQYSSPRRREWSDWRWNGWKP